MTLWVTLGWEGILQSA